MDSSEKNKRWRYRKRLKQYCNKCKWCGSTTHLIVLTAKPKEQLTLAELRKVETACLPCLLKDQPLLNG